MPEPDPTVIPSITDRAADAANVAAIDQLGVADRFPYIVAWAKLLGFTPNAVASSVAQAEADNAPRESIQKIDGEWLVLDDIENESNRLRVEQIARSPQGWTR